MAVFLPQELFSKTTETFDIFEYVVSAIHVHKTEGLLILLSTALFFFPVQILLEKYITSL
jgi:hypothetical protein